MIIFLPVYGIDVITLVTIEWEARKNPQKNWKEQFQKSWELNSQQIL